jgi:adenosine deaminase
MTAQHAYQLAYNSFEASFLDASAKRRHMDKLNAVFETF